MKALVVDDNKNDRMLLSMMLRSRGYEVAEAGNGAEALEQVEKGASGIIVSDILMPDMDGFTLIKNLKKDLKTKAIPFVFYTATFVSDADRELGMSLGASKFLIKPLEPKEFLDEIDAALREFEAGKLKPVEPAMTNEEYLEKYSDRIFRKLDSSVKMSEEESKKRKETGDALRESENMFEGITAAANDAIILMDDNEKIAYWNKAAEKIFGYSRQEILNKELHAILAPEKYHDAYRKGFARFRKTGEGTMIGKTLELEAKRKDGTVFRIELSVSALKLKGKWQSIGVVRDITERKQNEDKLKSQNEFTKLVIDSLPHPFYVINTKDHTIAMANAATSAMGKGATCYAISHKKNTPCRSEEHPCPLEEVKRTKKPTTVEHIHYDRDGNPRNVEIHCYPMLDTEGNVVQAIEYSLDITQRRRAEDMLRQSEEKYRTMYDSSSDAIMLLDEKGFFDCNNATLQMFGFAKKEDFTKVHPSQVSPPIQPDDIDSLTAANDKIAEAFRTGTNHFEWMHRRQNGEDFPADVLLAAFDFKGKQVMQATVRDISERKKEKEALRKFIEKQTVLVELSQLMLNDVDIPTLMNVVVGLTGKTLGLEYCNILELLPDGSKLVLRAGAGWKEELIGSATVDAGEGSHACFTLRSNEAVVLEDARKEQRFKLSPLLQDRGIISGISVIIPGIDRKFGIMGVYTTQLRHFTDDDIIYIQNVVNTLSLAIGRIKSYDALVKSEQKIRQMAENIREVFWIAPPDFQRIEYISPAFEEIWGRKTSEVYQNPKLWLDAILPEHRDIVLSARKVLEGGEPYIIQYCISRPDGTMRWVEDRGYPIKYSSERFFRITGVVQDITERKRTEEEIIFAKNEALRASRVKTDFLSTISHELKTPLIAILGFSSILKKKQAGELNEKQEHYVDGINVGGTHLLSKINEILDMVRVESGEKISLSIETFSAPEAIENTLFFVNEKAEPKKITIKTEIEPELDMISADKLRFKQILLNLIDNAIKFSKPDGGTVTIAARKDGDMAKFAISDTGIGIREEHMDKLFDMFYQIDSGLNRKCGGTGIGLAVTKQLVEQHGGRIWVESRYGEGTTFTFTLPLEVKKETGK